MRKLLLILYLNVLLVGSVGHVQATETAVPLYSVAFSVRLSSALTRDRPGEGVRVATLLSDGSWQLKTLPGAYSGPFDVGFVAPAWTADGHTLYTTVQSPGSQTHFLMLYTYDVFTQKLTPLMDLDTRHEPEYEAAAIDSISPDGRYLWFEKPVRGDGQLVDVLNKRAFPPLECATEAQAWTADSLVDFNRCAHMLRTIDLATGKVRQVPVDLSFYGSYGWQAVSQNGKSYLVGGPLIDNEDGPVVMLNLDTGDRTTLSTGHYFTVAADRTFATFASGDRLMRLNLATLRVADTGPIGHILAVTAQGGNLYVWSGQDNGNALELTRVTLTAASRAEQLVYSGPQTAEQNLQFAPDGKHVALQFEAGDDKMRVELYGLDGPIWTSSQPDLREGYSEPAWTPDSTWLFLDGADRSAAVNTRSAQLILAPQPAAHYLNSSPDGAWWLFSILGESDDPNDRLVVFNHDTGKVVVLADNVLLGHHDPYHWPSYQYYVWSPPVR